jgi:hypothetical protein
VAEISGNTWHIQLLVNAVGTSREPKELTRATADIVQSQLGDTGVQLHQQRERLANATTSTENGDLGGL